MKFLITIIIFLIMLMFLIYINREYKSKVFLLFSFLLVFLVILAYFTKPFPTDDLQFYYNLMDEMKIKGLEWTLFSSPYKYTILINMYLYIFSLIGNYQLLPAVTIFIVYIIIFYIYSYYFNRTSRFNMSILILILFSLLFFRWNISGIRNILSFAILSLAFFFDILDKRANTLVTKSLYISSVLIHASVLPILLIRILFFITMKYPILKKFWYIIPFWGIIIIGLAELLNIAGIPLLSYLSNMVLIYSKYINYDTRVTIIHICFFLIIIYMIIYIHIYNKRITQNNYYQYMDILLLFHAGSIVFPVAFDRYISFLLIIYVYIFIDYFLIVKHKVRKNMTYAALILISIGMLAYQYVDAMNAWLFYL